MQEYSQADLTRLFHLPKSLMRSLAAAGYIARAAAEGKTPYSFQDLLVLRMASALKSAKISSSKITAALGAIRASLPPGSLFGKTAVVRDRSNEWEANSGQYALPLAAAYKTPAVGSIALAHSHYARGHALEESDVVAARAAYLAALNAHGDHLESRINLGRLLHLNGELQEAEKVYRQAKNSSALLSFNLGILLEDLNREEEAAGAYREALAQDPLMHDAHFNLSRLHEKGKRPREALRHLLAYRRHIQKYGQ